MWPRTSRDIAKEAMEDENTNEQGPLGIYAQTDMGWSNYGPWRYQILEEPLLSETLERFAQVQNLANGRINSVSFQPCLNPQESSQDRRAAEEWDMPNGQWTFAAVFDGHAGHDLVDLAVEIIPKAVFDGLQLVHSSQFTDSSVFVDNVASMLVKTLQEFDNQLMNEFLNMFPGGEAQLESEDLTDYINDHDKGGERYRKTILCMRGTTAIISLIDHQGNNLWIANLGDCQATLVCQDGSGSLCGSLLTQNHNGANPIEADRLRTEHPNEDATCILHDRVLGAITVTRALGDFAFKLPPIYTHKVFLRAEPGFKVQSRVEDFIARSHTPPYISNTAEIYHQKLSGNEKFIILNSDGLSDIYQHHSDPSNEWARIIEDTGINEPNPALRLLRRAVGGSMEYIISQNLTVEMSSRWMDDTTITVVTLPNNLF